MAAVAVQADNRCVGGGGGGDSSPAERPPAASAGRKRRDGPEDSRNSCSSSSSDDDDDSHSGVTVADVTGGTGKRLKYLKQRMADLDDLDLLDRHLESADDGGPPDPSCATASVDDCTASVMAAELRQKTKDLVLAARLGKALLAKNDELSLLNERLAEEYGDKLEEIEQDRHRLRRQLAQARAECEQRCHELQADLRDLQAVLDNREHQLRESDKQKRAVVRELTDQNCRLQSHIRELSQAETELRHKCCLLEDSHQPQYVNGKWNGVGTGSPTSITNGGSTTDYGSLTPDDYRSLDVLRDEIDMKSVEKQRLQKRMAELRADRDRLAELLELKDHTLAEYRAEAAHYEHRSTMLAKQLDDALCSGGGGGGTGDWKSRDDKCASCSRAVDGSGRTGPQSGMSLLDELEQAQAGVAAPQPRMVEVDLTRRQPLSDEPADLAADQTAEVTDVERWAVRLCDALDRRLELSADTRYRLLKLISTGVSDDGDGKPSCAVDLAELVRNRDGRVAELTCELSVRDTELQAAREERDLAIQDKMDAMRIHCARCADGEDDERAATSSTSDADEKSSSSLIPELLRKAWEQRDGAVRRKNTVQVQLARTRVDILQANGQLMEAIGQKVELSQQLEQWQMDMQALLDEQMRRKLLAPPPQSAAAGSTPEYADGGNKCSAAGAFPSMSSSSLGSLGSSGLMNSLLMIAGGGGGNANR